MGIFSRRKVRDGADRAIAEPADAPGLDPAECIGKLWAWGSNSRGQLGCEDPDDRSLPDQVPGLPVVRAVVAGSQFAHALGVDNQLWSWGANEWGQLNHEQRDYPEPIHSDGPVQYTQLAAGARTSYGLLPNGQAVAWGSNEFNERGNGVSGFRNVPTPDWLTAVRQEVPFAQIAAGGSRAAAIDADGQLWAWGDHQHRRLGLGRNHHQFEVLVPREVPGLSDVTEVVLGERAGYALTADGMVWQWGDLGGDHQNPRHADSPVRVAGLDQVVALSAGNTSAFALKKDGSVWMWGRRSTLVERDGIRSRESVDMPHPAQLLGLPAASALAAGWDTLTVLGRDGSLWEHPINRMRADSGRFEGGPVRLSYEFDGGAVVAVEAYGSTTYAIASAP